MITQEIYKKRREKLFDQMINNSVAIVIAAPEYPQTNDMNYPYWQNANMLYLTGFDEPRSVAVFIKNDTGNQFILFCQDRDSAIEQWMGYRIGQEKAIEEYGADKAYSINDIDTYMPSILENKQRVYHAYGRNLKFDKKLLHWLNQVRKKLRLAINMPGELFDIERIVNEMRLIKEPEEIELLQQSTDINVEAFRRAIQSCQPGQHEYDVEGELSCVFRKHGAQQNSFPTIAGSGKNSCVLHYDANSDELKEGDLFLLDGGCEFHDYASDMTRVFPINGKFTQEQRAIYDIVLRAQLAGIEELKPGKSYFAAHEMAIRVITEGLCEVGLLEGDIEALIQEKKYSPFYMHKFSHWIGIEVHDPSLYGENGQWRALQPGMVMSAEPGIYIKPELEGVDSKWWGIGVRIEDLVLITENGNKVLSAAMPKTADEIEKLMQS